MNGRLLGLLVCLLGFAWSPPALAWGDIGHRIIGEIAFQQLNDTARERVKALIRRDPEFDTFAESCSWPDRPRRRAVEHYVNLPRDAEGFAQDPCPLAEKCVVSAIDLKSVVIPASRDLNCSSPTSSKPLRQSRADGPDRHGWILLSGKAWASAILALPRIQDRPLVT